MLHSRSTSYIHHANLSALILLQAEKIKKKRSSVLGTLHVAHSSSLDQVDHKILEAKWVSKWSLYVCLCLCNICNKSVCISKRNALSEVTACLRERLLRWQQIERLCGFPIFRNPGLANLTAQLYSESITLGLPRAHQPSWSCHSSVHGSIEDLLEEPSSPILPQMPGIPKEQSDLNYLLWSPLM